MPYKVNDFYKVGLTLLPFTLVGLFDEEVQQCHAVCALHRFSFGIYWKGKRPFCQIPKEVAGHKKDCAKADRAVNGALAKKICFLTTKVVPIGSSKLLHAPFLIGNSRAQ